MNTFSDVSVDLRQLMITMILGLLATRGREGLLSTLGSWADLTQSFGLGSSRFQLIGGALWLSSSPTPESNVLL